MLISYADFGSSATPRQRARGLVLLLIAINIAFALSSVMWWTFMSLFVAEPIKWATWTGLGARPELFEYPFTLLWMLPLAGATVSYVLMRNNNRRLAVWSGFFPILFLGLMICWYYFAPIGWR